MAPAPRTRPLLEELKPPLLVALALLALCGPAGTHAQTRSAAADKAALVAFYNATGGANWTTDTNWTSEESLSSWHGVATDSDGRVTELVLNDNGLAGTLPTALGDLSELEQLDLRNNALSGALPSELANLASLATLRLDESRALTGPLPDGLRELSDLATVNIDKTELCAPEDDAFRTWLDAITFTGLICPPAEQSVIDVAVFYTPAARVLGSGFVGIETEIALMAAETNMAYRDSGVNQRIKLVAVEEVEGYTQAEATWLEPTRGYYTDLARLRDPSDGYMDEIHRVLAAVGADIVMLVRWGRVSGTSAMGYPSTSFVDHAYGAVSFQGGLESGVFAHELGHIMGLVHDRYEECGRTDCINSTQFPYRFGYVNQRAFDPDDPTSPNPDPTVPTTARWRTIMAYNNQLRGAGFLVGEWLLRFSDPDAIHPDPGGDPLGKAGLEPAAGLNGPSDTVRMLNRTRGLRGGISGPRRTSRCRSMPRNTRPPRAGTWQP